MELVDIAGAVERGDADAALRLTDEAVAAGVAAAEVLDRGLVAGMNVVGERFRRHELFLPDVLLAARAMTTALVRLEPLLAGTGRAAVGKVVLGSVRGDLHDIGKNLVAILLRGAGFEVVDLGHDVAPERFVDSAVAAGAGVIGLSALLTTTMPVMREVVELVRARGLGGRVKVIVGGAPVSQEFAREIGADAYGFDAASAVDRVRGLLGVG